MRRHQRRVRDEEVEKRPHGPSLGEPLNGPAGELLRFQRLAGNSAVNALMRSPNLQHDDVPAVQRDGSPSPAPAEQKPKKAGVTVIVDDIGSFLALSAAFTASRGRGAEDQKETPIEIVVTKEMDELSPLFHRRAAEGEPFPRVVFDFPGMPIVLNDVVITSYSVSSGPEPLETMTFSGTKPAK